MGSVFVLLRESDISGVFVVTLIINSEATNGSETLLVHAPEFVKYWCQNIRRPQFVRYTHLEMPHLSVKPRMSETLFVDTPEFVEYWRTQFVRHTHEPDFKKKTLLHR